MSLHKLTAGDGYEYLTRQVAAMDSTEKGHTGLASYYTQKGETPGVWVGSGLAGIEGLNAGDIVTAEQMRFLFGSGHHPLARQRGEALPADATAAQARDAIRLGQPFKVYPHDMPAFRIDVKHLPGRPKTDRLDAVWLCKVAERDMLRPSFVPPPPIRELRDLTRYRSDLVSARSAEKQRVEKLLEDAQIKLSVVASDLFGVSGRAMMAALVRGERDPKVLAGMALKRLKAKTARLEEAFEGRFSDHHAFLLRTMLGRIDGITSDIAVVDGRIAEHVAPFADALERLDEIPGIGPTIAQVIVAEIGLDMTRFPTAAHLAAWARFAPVVKESAGRTKGNSGTGKGNRYLARVLGEAVVGAARTDTFLGQRYRRLVRRRGRSRALVAVGRSILTVVWHILSEPDTHFHDLGADYYELHVNQGRKVRNHIRELQQLGFHVTLEPAAA